MEMSIAVLWTVKCVDVKRLDTMVLYGHVLILGPIKKRKGSISDTRAISVVTMGRINMQVRAQSKFEDLELESNGIAHFHSSTNSC